MDQPVNVLVLYTGGTLGMLPGPNGYEPASGHLATQLRQMHAFHEAGMPEFTTPPTRTGRRAHFDLLEYAPLIDSSNMRRAGWVNISKDIADRYAAYDAFIVLHGTDTMAYTASALSFMLEGLDKPVILTGSQIPLTHVRNDGVDNLIGALTLVTDHQIPEVCLYFRGSLMRGNRAQKTDATGFNAFHSGNYPALAKVGIGVDVRWDLVRTPPSRGLSLRPITCEHVAALRLFPGLTATTLRRILQPPLQGLVLETYGSGNAPNDDPELLAVLKEACDAGIVVVSVTQCHRGRVVDDYATGRSLHSVGVIPGADMTPEAALTKLSWLLSLGLTTDEVRTQFGSDLRGEMTAAQTPPTLGDEQQFLEAVTRAMEQMDHAPARPVAQRLFPMLLSAAAQRDDTASLVRLVAAGASPHSCDTHGSTALHIAAKHDHLASVTCLLQLGARPTARNLEGQTPADVAVSETCRHLLEGATATRGLD
ncbi:MAG: asparaginase [Myxococcota bacterium]